MPLVHVLQEILLDGHCGTRSVDNGLSYRHRTNLLPGPARESISTMPGAVSGQTDQLGDTSRHPAESKKERVAMATDESSRLCRGDRSIPAATVRGDRQTYAGPGLRRFGVHPVRRASTDNKSSIRDKSARASIRGGEDRS